MIPLILAASLADLPPLVWRAEGRAEAERDIAAGTMRWKVYGYMAGLSAEHQAARLKLRERFGVELVAVAQCVVTEELVERADGYNDRIREEVERGHGADALSRVWEEAYEESRPERVATRWFLKASAVAGVVALLRLLWRALVNHQRPRTEPQ